MMRPALEVAGSVMCPVTGHVVTNATTTPRQRYTTPSHQSAPHARLVVVIWIVVWVWTHRLQVGQDAGKGRRRLDTHGGERGRGLCPSADERECPQTSRQSLTRAAWEYLQGGAMCAREFAAQHLLSSCLDGLSNGILVVATQLFRSAPHELRARRSGCEAVLCRCSSCVSSRRPCPARARAP